MMLKIISTKNESEIPTLGRYYFAEPEEATSLAQDVSIFGDTGSYLLRPKDSELEKLDNKYLNVLQNSVHSFLIIGSGVDFEKHFKNLDKKVEKKEEKKVFDFPADLVAALQKHDKKNSWNFMVKELSKKDAEPIHGSCVFAYKSLLVYVNQPSTNSPDSGVKDFSWQQAKRNAVAGKREKEEVRDKYFNLIMAYHKARMGQGSLATQLETWVLEN